VWISFFLSVLCADLSHWQSLCDSVSWLPLATHMAGTPLFAATHAFILSHSGQVLPLSVICAFIFYFFLFFALLFGGGAYKI